MIRRNKKIISLIVLTNLVLMQLPTNMVAASVSENSSIVKYSASDIDFLAKEHFKGLYQLNNSLSKDEFTNVDLSSSSKLTKVAITSNDENIPVDYLKTLASNLKADSRIIRSFTSLLENDKLTLYFYAQAFCTDGDINDILQVAKNLTDASFGVSINIDNYHGVSCDTSSEFFQNIMNTPYAIGMNQKSELFNISSTIPAEDSIPKSLGISAYPIVDSSLNDVKSILTMTLELNNEIFLVKNPSLNKKLLFNDLQLLEKSNVKVNIIAEAMDGTIKSYSSESTIDKSILGNFNYNIPSVKSEIINNKVNYTAMITNDDPSYTYPLFSVVEYTDSSTSTGLISQDNSSVTFEGNIDSAIKTLSLYYMDNNGQVNKKEFSDFIDLSKKSYEDNENLILKFTGTDIANNYSIIKVNDRSLANPIGIYNKRATLDWISEDYFINDGLNNITISNGVKNFTLSFKGIVSHSIYKEIPLEGIESIDQNSKVIKVDSSSDKVELKILLNRELNEDKSIVNFITADNIEFNSRFLNNNTLLITIDNFDKDLDFNGTLNLNLKDKNNEDHILSYNFIRDINAPTIEISTNGVISKNGRFYFKGNKDDITQNNIKFKLYDRSDSIKVGSIKNLTNPSSRVDYNLDVTTNNLIINNPKINIETKYEISLTDKYNTTKKYTFTIFPDTDAPNIILSNSKSDQYKIQKDTLYIQNNKISDNSFDFNFKVNDNGANDLSTIDPDSVKLYFIRNNIESEITDFTFNDRSEDQSVNIKFPDDKSDYIGTIKIVAKDITGNENVNSLYNLKYYKTMINSSSIGYKIIGNVTNGPTAFSTVKMDSNDIYTLKISNKLERDRIALDLSKNLLDNINSADFITYTYNNTNQDIISYSGVDNPIVPLDLKVGRNSLDFTVHCSNGSYYSGTINIDYDYNMPEFELIDTDNKSVLLSSNNILKKSLKEIRIKDSGFHEVTSGNVTIKGDTESYSIDINKFRRNNDYLIYDFDNFKEGNYELSYNIQSSFNEGIKDDFNSKDKGLTLSGIKFIYDVTKPSINSNVLTNNYKTTKIYGANSKILIDNSKDSDVILSDNLTGKLSIDYKIYDTVSNKLVDIGTYNEGISLTDLYNESRYRLELIVKDSAGNESNYSGLFIYDTKAPIISINGLENVNNGLTNKIINPEIVVKDNSLNNITATTFKKDDNGEFKKIDGFEIQYINSEDYDIEFNKKLNLIKETGIYKIIVNATDRNNLLQSYEENFILDVTAPKVDMKLFTNKYSDCKVFPNSDSTIFIGNDGGPNNNSVDIGISDNFGDDIKVEYAIVTVNSTYNPKYTEYTTAGISLKNLRDGRYQLNLKVTDKAGNTLTEEGLDHIYGYFTIDSTSPIISLDMNNKISKDKFINTFFDAKFSIYDESIKNAVVTITDDENKDTIIPVGVQEASIHSININKDIEAIYNLKDGRYKINASAFDRAGHMTSIAPKELVIDRTSPTISPNGFTNSFSNCSVFTSNGTRIFITDDNTKTDSNYITVFDELTESYEISYEIYNEDHSSPLDNGDYTKDGISLSKLGEGRYQIDFSVTDDANNKYSFSGGHFIIDSTSPTISIDGLTLNSNSFTNSTLSPVINIYDTSISSINVRLTLPNGSDVLYPVSDLTSKSFAIPLNYLTENGQYTLNIDATDKSNRKTALSKTFTIDKNAPTINGATINGKTVNINAMNYATSHSSPIVIGYSDNITENKNLTLNIKASKNGSTINLSNGDALKEDGEYIITITSTDLAGNTSDQYTFKLIVDTVFPEITSSGIVDGYYYNKDVTPTWSVDDTKSIVSATLNGSSFTSSTINAEGSYTLNIQAKDEAGNITNKTINFVIDKTAPKITVDNIENLGFYKSAVTPIIKWDDKDGIASTLLNNINYFGEAIDKDGSYVLYVKVVDKAGNISDLSLKFRLNVSTPEISIIGIKDGDVLSGPITPKFKFKDTVEYKVLLNGKEYHGEEIVDEGNYSLTITAKDEDGVETTETINFKIENTSSKAVSKDIQEDVETSSNIGIAAGSIVALLLIALTGYLIYNKQKRD
ncbi:Ig-like domain-containing protein [Clostridium paraputrificum]|uniref:Ig-like domain-containing protein n=1 Tax=Clostridium paraputrificum TaxID=29363 RepID=UPI003D33E3DC